MFTRRAILYITLFTITKPTEFMEEETGSALSQLGKQQSLFGASTEKVEELEAKVAELERRIMMMQGELIGSIEALQRRVNSIENNKSSNSVLDFISSEELNDIAGTSIGVWPEADEENKEDVTVVESGFTYNPTDIEKGSELSVEEEIHSQMLIADMVTEENPGLFEDEPAVSTHAECAQAIIAYIDEHGGIANADWKKKGLTPDGFEYADRVKVRDIVLADEGITYWKRNNMWWFYYRKEEGLEAAHERVYGNPP